MLLAYWQEILVATFQSYLASRAHRRAGSRNQKRHQRGAAAVEFALVAAPFFALLFGLFEIMLIFFVQTALESAVNEESRKIKTGQANVGAGIDAATFKANVCGRMAGIIDCNKRLFVTVQNQPAGGSLTSPLTDPDILKNPAYEQNTAPGSIVVVRGFYYWKVITPGISTIFSNTTSPGPNGDLGKNNRLLVATTAFQNEPFQ
jgi:Flp pilus assembly protein TadG